MAERVAGDGICTERRGGVSWTGAPVGLPFAESNGILQTPGLDSVYEAKTIRRPSDDGAARNSEPVPCVILRNAPAIFHDRVESFTSARLKCEPSQRWANKRSPIQALGRNRTPAIGGRPILTGASPFAGN